MNANTGTKSYGILYGGEGRSDFRIEGEWPTIEEARKHYDPDARIGYMDGLLGGATLVELEPTGSPVRTIEILAADEPGEE